MVELAAAKEPVPSDVVKQKLFSLRWLEEEEEEPYAAVVILEEMKIPPAISTVTATAVVVTNSEGLAYMTYS